MTLARVRFPAFLAFFLSGTSSLIFQNIWGRMLHHVFGAAPVAVSTVVSVFMGGLGLGAWVAGRWADRIRHPIITYALAELGVGLWGLLVPVLVDPQGWLATINAWLRTEMGSGSLGFMLGRFAFVVPVLLIPTTLMGASLPLLARHFVQQQQRAGGVGSRVGVLYALNTFGGVTGVLVAGFWWMPSFGVQATNVLACSLNFALAAGIFVFRRSLLGDTWEPGQRLQFLPARAPAGARGDVRAGEDPSPVHRDEDAPSHLDESDTSAQHEDASKAPVLPPVSSFARKASVVAFGVSGAAALCYEVVWTRALAMTIGASVYSFALILATFLIGIASGSSIGAAVLAARRYLLAVVAVVSLLLSLLANAMWGVSSGVGIWVIPTSLCALAIGVVCWTVLNRTRTVGVPGTEPDLQTPILVMLGIPVLASLIGLVTFDGRLPPIIAAVTCTVFAFLALMVLVRRQPVLQLAFVQVFIAVATFANYVFQDEIPCAFAHMVNSVDNLPQHVGTVQFFMFLTASLCTLPATLGMGAMFPLTLRVWTAGGRAVGRDVGLVYASNTAGSIFGAWLPGFLLMPLMGLERTLHAGIVLNLALGLLMLFGSARLPRVGGSPKPDQPAVRLPAWHAASVYVLSPLLPVLAVLLYLGTAHPGSALRWDLTRMTLGVFRVSRADDACKPDVWGRPEILYYNDGLSTTVSVERWGDHYALKNNGKVEASNGGDMPTQIMVSGFPLLMHPQSPRGIDDVAIIGFGSGVTVGSALQWPVEDVDVIELERSVVEASKFFEGVNNLEYGLGHFPYVDMPRLDVINDDGRNYLASTSKKYDVIVSEPSNPWITGVSDLFTVDHFEVTKDRLKPGGVYCQWVQLYELSPENIKTIYRTFASHFEHVVVFSADELSTDTILVGSDQPLSLDLERFQKNFTVEKVRQELERAYVDSPHDAFARVLLASKEEVMQYTQIEYRKENGTWKAKPEAHNDEPCKTGCRRQPVPLNTDDNALIEFSAPRDLIGYERYAGYLNTVYSADWPYARLTEAVEGFGEGEDTARHWARLAMSLVAHGREAEATRVLKKAQMHELATREAKVAVDVVRALIGDREEPPVVVEPPVPGPQLAKKQANRLQAGFDAVREAVDAGDWQGALTRMEGIPGPLRKHSGPGTKLLYGYLLYKTAAGDPTHYAEAVDELEALLRDHPDYVRQHPEARYYLARAYYEDLQYQKAVDNMKAYCEAPRGVAGGGGEL